MERDALVLEGGGFRGIFTAAVLDVFLREELIFDYVIGVSAGAAYGVSYVSRQPERNLRVNDYVSDKRYCGIRHLLRTGNFFNWDFVYREIPTTLIPFDFKRFSESGTMMKVVLTNCVTGKPEYMELSGATPERFREILTATSSLPYVSTMKKIDGELYLDGGIADAIPAEQAFRDGNRRIVAILTRDADYRKEKGNRYVSGIFYRKFPNLAKAMIERIERYNRMLETLAKLEKDGNAFVIRPSRPIAISRLENNVAVLKKVYNDAFRETEFILPALKKWLQQH